MKIEWLFLEIKYNYLNDLNYNANDLSQVESTKNLVLVLYVILDYTNALLQQYTSCLSTTQKCNN